MKIDIQDKAYDYILNNGGKVYIYTNSIRGCCGGGGQKPVDMDPRIELGAPSEADIESYRIEEYQELTIYIHRYIKQEMLKNKEIVLKQFLGIIKKLFLSQK